uniref:Uncharacterized protein n=1 Tax=Proboscia inermis TaxID=420281 RepID=A0A7S0CGH2_9STRA|mmetsp:Transcript_43780/g.44252  ORF Transcript_43780/g.44252 Transcript_43780/m.44252 type:complete len:103 (+) Transcript_43780:543-851(+)
MCRFCCNLISLVGFIFGDLSLKNILFHKYGIMKMIKLNHCMRNLRYSNVFLHIMRPSGRNALSDEGYSSNSENTVCENLGLEYASSMIRCQCVHIEQMYMAY